MRFLIVSVSLLSSALACAVGCTTQSSTDSGVETERETTAGQAHGAAGDPTTGVQKLVYYTAEVRKYFMASVGGVHAGERATERVLAVKTLDPQNSRFREIACISDGTQAPYISPVYMTLDNDNDNALTISDSPNPSEHDKLTGTGTVSGVAWDWNYLTFKMSYQACPAAQCKSQVLDTNFVVRGTNNRGAPTEQLVARKQLFLGDGTPYELYEAELDRKTAEEGDALFAEMGCPADRKDDLFGSRW